MEGVSRKQMFILIISLALVVLLAVVPLIILSQRTVAPNDKALVLLQAYAASWKGDTAYDLKAAEAVKEGVKKDDPSGGWVLGLTADDGSCWVVVVDENKGVEGPIKGSSLNCR